ncbi:MAG: type II toxin-antitoxin system RelE/ParE family toxin [Vulcanimicrobiota bacterium]
MAERVIRWSREALDDIDHACDYVGQSGERSASELASKIESLVNQLLEHPYIGRKIPEFDQEHLRERITKKFRILYRLTPEAIEIFGIYHSRKPLPEEV